MTPIQLHIPTPCAERWAAMTPAGPGRHCAACAKVVVDFTQKTDAEILAYLTGAASQSCGRFRAAQLGRPLQPPETTSRWRTWLGALLAAGSLGQLAPSKAAAQTAVRGTAGPLPAAVSSTQAAPSPAASRRGSSSAAGPAATLRPLGSRTVGGTVRDEATHDPLPGVTVLLKGTTLGTATGADGTFTLPIPGDAPTVQLGFHYIGYNSVEQAITLANDIPLAVTLNTDGVMLSGVVVVTPAKQPWPWHPRRLFNWGKYWLARPFRR